MSHLAHILWVMPLAAEMSIFYLDRSLQLWRCPIRCGTAFAAFPAVGDGGEGGAGGTARRCLLADRVKAALQRLLALVGAVHDAGVDGIRHLRLQQGLRHVLLLAGCRYEIRWLH